jgi:hypothetical protein
MHGIQTIQGMNRRNAEAQAIVARHEQSAQLPHGDGVKQEPQAPAAPITE